ncbi:MAG: tetratricopeptide repeat protein [Armatimonadetes bacterium]|nr:tetratricopeptide repeat protein [Armatimonadota bacterium]
MGEREARPHLDAGEEHLRREEWAQAEEAFRRATAAHPESPVAWSKLGVTLARQHRLEEAITALRQAISRNPRYAPGHSNLGNVYREQGRTAEALTAYQQAVEADPDYWIAHQNLGALYREQGRVSEAVGEFKKATRLSVRSGGARRGCFGPTASALALLLLLSAAALPALARLLARP